MRQDCCPVYELPDVQQVTGDTIRPGGLATTQRALALAHLPPAARVLDVGCGTGATVDYLTQRGLRATGIDPSTSLLQQAPERLSLSQARGEKLPFAARQFDAVFAECCLSLMDDAAQSLAEFARVLRPQGVLIISDMLTRNVNAITSARRLPLTCCVRGAFTRTEIETLLTGAGFAIRFWEDHSEALKQLTVAIIWEYGSLTNFWRSATAGSTVVAPAVANLNPGYFLLLAMPAENTPQEDKQWKS